MSASRIGPTRSGLPLAPRDVELIRLSAVYLATALRTGRREDQQAEALSDLSEDRAQLDTTAATLHAALLRRASTQPGLHVFALGALRVERGDERIQRWGGEKAGSRQAQAMFAFLFDRGERGVAKDEALERSGRTPISSARIWRSIAPLAVAPHARPRWSEQPAGDPLLQRSVSTRSGADRLSDVSAFLADLDEARASTNRVEALRRLEAARALIAGVSR
jgi:hypothetical protein